MLTGAQLRAMRALHGITQAQLAEKAKISPTSIAEFELGKRDMRTGTVAKLFDVLGVRVSYMLGEIEIRG